MTNEQIQREAAEIWAQLEQLDRSKEAREQLRRAGISENRIRSLYPLDFGDFIEGLQPLISADTLHEITAPLHLQELRNTMHWVMKQLPGLDRELALRLVEKSAFSDALGSLCRHICDCLPEVLADEDSRAEMARQAGILLWIAIATRIRLLDAAAGEEQFPVDEGEADWLLIGVSKALLRRQKLSAHASCA